MTAQLPGLHLKRGHTKPLHAGHPWVFADAVQTVEGEAEAGAEVRVLDPQGRVLGRGYYSPDSAIAVRLLTRSDESAGEALLASRLDAAIALRRDVLRLGKESPTTAYRLVNSEGDGLGGLIVDRYDSYLCVQLGTVGMDRRRETIFDLLEERLQPDAILDKSDRRIRSIEKLPQPQAEPFRGAMPEGPFEILENDLSLQVDLRPGKGQKTGLYLDQRDNRTCFAGFAEGRDVLDVFAARFALYPL